MLSRAARDPHSPAGASAVMTVGSAIVGEVRTALQTPAGIAALRLRRSGRRQSIFGGYIVARQVVSGAAARLDLHDGRGCFHADDRRSQLPQFHDPDTVHADRNGGVGIDGQRLCQVRRRLGLARGAWRRRGGGGRRVIAGRALYIPLSQDETRRRHRARYSSGFFLRLSADLRAFGIDFAGFGIRSASPFRSRADVHVGGPR